MHSLIAVEQDKDQFGTQHHQAVIGQKEERREGRGHDKKRPKRWMKSMKVQSSSEWGSNASQFHGDDDNR